MSLAPLAEVKAKFGSREELVKIVVGEIERPEGMSDDDFKEKMSKVSNRKLLKLHAAHEDVTKRFGSKAGLVDAIIAIVNKGKVDNVYRNKLLTMREAQLLDLHRGLSKKA